MRRPRPLSPMLPAAWLGALALAGCGPRDRSETTADATAGRTDTVATADVRPDTAESSARLSDANIVALLDEANKADSAAGAVAAGKATNAEV